MIWLVGREKKINKSSDRFNTIFTVYIISIIISIVLIGISFIPGGYKMAETILVGMGCSGITAAIMAIFIDLAQREEQKRKNSLFRYMFFNGFNQQLKKIFERLIWFDAVLDEIKLEKNIDYYMSLDFVIKAAELKHYECIQFEEAEERIKSLIQKYEKDNWEDSETVDWSKVTKMFNVIGIASFLLQEEIKNIENNKLYLVTNEIITEQEINDILVCTNKFVEYLSLDDCNYVVSIQFLFDGYKYLRELCGYEDELYITWQTRYEIFQMTLNDRRIKQAKRVIKKKK